MAMGVAGFFCFFFFLLFPILAQSQTQPTSFIFQDFRQGETNLRLDRDASIIRPSGLLRLTKRSNNVIGHAFYVNPIQMFEKNSSSSAQNAYSFSTTFVFEIVSPSSGHGGYGLAFLLAPSKQLPGADSGHYLGIFNPTNDGNASNHVIFVEFDTGNPKPVKPLINYRGINLTDHIKETMYVGFSASTGDRSSSHYISGWSFSLNGKPEALNVSALPRAPKEKESTPRSSTSEILEDWEIDCPHRFRYKDLYEATKGFRESEVIGVGGFGAVYRGVLPTNGSEVAVKKITRNSLQGMREFAAEIESLGRLRHKNLVNLHGKASASSDVYAYGILLLEVATGQRPIGSGTFLLMEWVNECQQLGRILDAVDPLLKSDYAVEEMELVLKLGLICSHQKQELRPTMRQVMRYLCGDELLPSNYDWSSIDSQQGYELSFPDFWKCFLLIRSKRSHASSSNVGFSSSSMENGR
ncbi:hypothetical protein Pint_34925 [Pistacia integerrima]|uniref:Uncharacterized protein n=1 Tax=Pistacia integerrima TaxID=434235 RepID=A0ACC0Y4G0_9ROSI|nr:hypothetical protein Pint_34925 [Pistacia integerrima]